MIINIKNSIKVILFALASEICAGDPLASSSQAAASVQGPWSFPQIVDERTHRHSSKGEIEVITTLTCDPKGGV